MHKRLLLFLLFGTLTTTQGSHISPSVLNQTLLNLMRQLTIELRTTRDNPHSYIQGCLLCSEGGYDCTSITCHGCTRLYHETCLQTFWTRLMRKGTTIKKSKNPRIFCPFCSVCGFNSPSHSIDDFLLMATELFKNSFPTHIASLKHIFSPTIERDERETVEACNALLFAEEKLGDENGHWHRKTLFDWSAQVYDEKNKAPILIDEAYSEV